MRQFLLAGNVAYGARLPLTAGAVAFTYLANGEETIDANGTKITDKFYINLFFILLYILVFIIQLNLN